MFMSLRLLFLLTVLLLFFGCESDLLYKKSYPIPEEGWTYRDTLVFDFSIPDTLHLYDLQLEVRHHTDFPFQNLYIRIRTRFPDGQAQSQNLSLELMDQVGFWQGDCSGQTCTFGLSFQENVFFQQTGKYQIILEQYSRRDRLEGVESIELAVVEKGVRPSAE